MSIDQTTANFLEVIQQFKWPDPLPVSYRLYHDEQGLPLFYTMEDLPGTYIEVDQPTYVTASYSVRVVDGKLIMIESKPLTVKLKPVETDGVCCHPQDICVVVSSDQPNQRWKLSNNDQH